MEASTGALAAKVAKSSGRGSAPGERRGGRQKGTPNKATGEVRDLAQVYGPKAIEAAAKLAGLVFDEVNNEPVGVAASEQARIAALGIILDRAYGKATQVIAGDDDNPIKHAARIEVVFVNG